MASMQEYRDEQLQKIASLKNLGIDLYPSKSNLTISLDQLVEQFDSLTDSEQVVAGRVISIRQHGKLSFLDLEQNGSTIQIMLRVDDISSDYPHGKLGYGDINLLTRGDFVEISGTVTHSKTKQPSILASSIRVLSKVLRPLPEKLDDKETRLRRRYLDLAINPEVRERFVRRSVFWQATRQFLLDEGFIEINTPVLEHTTGGADANPFVTHMDALDQDFYLRISHELPLKRLIGGGYEKVFDIGPRFRNENYSDEHLPEHIAMESYVAYQDYQDGMDMYERMIKFVTEKTWGTLQFKDVNGFEVNLDQPWPRVKYADVMKERFDVDVFNPDFEQLKKILKDNKVELDGDVNLNRALDNVWKIIRRESAGPYWMINEPVAISPLSKAEPSDPRLTQRFHPIIGGSELGNGFSELNDPQEQLARFLEQQKLRAAGDEEAMMLDIDFVEMLEYGMPPACGWGNSERNFWFFEGVTAREGVIFPNLRSEVDETTKKIYPEINFEKIEKIDRARLPESAAVEGTHKLYLDDWAQIAFEARIEKISKTEDDETVLMLDQSAFYPGGGGQPCDLGAISWDGGQLELAKVSKDNDGVISHEGILNGELPKIGDTVTGKINAEKRHLHSRLHCAGHLLDLGVKQAGLDWKSGISAHFPRRCYVNYDGEVNADEYEEIMHKIETSINDYITNGGEVSSAVVPSEKAHEMSEYIPQNVLDSYQNVHIAKYPDNFNICCGGTHVRDISEIGNVKITKIKKKNGKIRVSYELL
jgi:lysyl-tRNA synthetase class 2